MRGGVALLLVLSFLCANVNAQKELKDFYLNRSLKQDNQQFQFKILDDDKHGVWFYRKNKFYHWYKAQHVLSTQGASSGVLLHGVFEGFYESKQLAQRGRFSKGLKSGEWLYWREDGTLRRSESWKNGVMRGDQNMYDESGQVVETITLKRWSSERRVADSLIQTKGNKERITLFDEQGKVSAREDYKNGKLHGDVRSYEDGKLTDLKRYKYGEELVKEEKNKEKKEEKAEPEEKTPFFKRIFSRKEKSEKEPKEKREKKAREKSDKEKSERKKKKAKENTDPEKQ